MLNYPKPETLNPCSAPACMAFFSPSRLVRSVHPRHKAGALDPEPKAQTPKDFRAHALGFGALRLFMNGLLYAPTSTERKTMLGFGCCALSPPKFRVLAPKELQETPSPKIAKIRPQVES